MLALRRIGLDAAVREAGHVLGAGSLRRWDGKILSRSDLPAVEAALGAPTVAIHRAALQRLLAEALEATEIEIETGAEIATYLEGKDG